MASEEDDTMADWDKIKRKVGRVANSAIKNTEEMADIASMRIKIRSLESKKDDQYELLGMLTYRQIKTGMSQAERIAPVIEEIDSLRARIRELGEKLEAAKAAREQRRASDIDEDVEDDAAESTEDDE